jgi:hypothetical protein
MPTIELCDVPHLPESCKVFIKLDLRLDFERKALILKTLFVKYSIVRS